MKKFSLLLALVAALTVSSSAFAQVAQCPDEDGDGYAVCSPSCVLPASLKCGDCDDDHENINPGATELWEDGLDNDCKTESWDSQTGSTKGDRVSLGAVVVARFARGLGRSITPKSSSELRLLKDIMACKGSSDCATDYVGGKLNPATGYRLVDTDCDGVLNVVADSYSPTLQDQDKCKKAARRSAPAVRRAPKARRRPAPSAAPVQGSATSADPAASAPKASAKGARSVVDYSVPIAKAQATADDAKKVADEASAKVNTFDAALQGHTEQLSALDAALAEQAQAIEAETERAMEAEDLIDTKAQGAIDRAVEAYAKGDEALAAVSELEKKGVMVEVSTGAAVILQNSASVTKNGKEYQMRGNTSPGAYVGLNVGYANESGRFGGFFNLLPLADQGPKDWESGIAYQGGAEATFTALHGLGVHVLFQQHDAGGSVVGANSYARGGGAGLSYVSMTSGSNFKVGFQGRLTAGVESYGAGKGSDTSAFAALSLGINFGFGPK